MALMNGRGRILIGPPPLRREREREKAKHATVALRCWGGSAALMRLFYEYFRVNGVGGQFWRWSAIFLSTWMKWLAGGE